MPEYRGVRLARGEIPRATTQTAVTLSLLMGNGHKKWNNQVLRGLAAHSMLGQLRSSVLDIDMVRLDVATSQQASDALAAYRAWRASEARQAHVERVHQLGQMTLEAVACPLDGATALYEGRSGSVSALAVGRAPCFVAETFADNFGRGEEEAGVAPAPAYLVAAVGHEALAPKVVGQGENRRVSQHLETALDRWESRLAGRRRVTDAPVPVKQFTPACELFRTIIDALDHDGCEPVVGVNLEGSNYLRWHPEFGRRVVYRKLDGSAVVAGLGAFLGHLGAGVCVARLPQVVLLALAARAMNGRLYAIPLEEGPPHESPSIDKVWVPKGALLRRESDFVQDTNALLCVSSITEVCIMDRVRFSSALIASAESMLASVTTRSVERRAQAFDLKHAQFWEPSGERSADDVLNDLRDKLDPPEGQD